MNPLFQEQNSFSIQEIKNFIYYEMLIWSVFTISSISLISTGIVTSIEFGLGTGVPFLIFGLCVRHNAIKIESAQLQNRCRITSLINYKDLMKIVESHDHSNLTKTKKMKDFLSDISPNKLEFFIKQEKLRDRDNYHKIKNLL